METTENNIVKYEDCFWTALTPSEKRMLETYSLDKSLVYINQVNAIRPSIDGSTPFDKIPDRAKSSIAAVSLLRNTWGTYLLSSLPQSRWAKDMHGIRESFLRTHNALDRYDYQDASSIKEVYDLRAAYLDLVMRREVLKAAAGPAHAYQVEQVQLTWYLYVVRNSLEYAGRYRDEVNQICDMYKATRNGKPSGFYKYSGKDLEFVYLRNLYCAVRSILEMYERITLQELHPTLRERKVRWRVLEVMVLQHGLAARISRLESASVAPTVECLALRKKLEDMRDLATTPDVKLAISKYFGNWNCDDKFISSVLSIVWEFTVEQTSAATALACVRLVRPLLADDDAVDVTQETHEFLQLAPRVEETLGYAKVQAYIRYVTSFQYASHDQAAAIWLAAAGASQDTPQSEPAKPQQTETATVPMTSLPDGLSAVDRMSLLLSRLRTPGTCIVGLSFHEALTANAVFGFNLTRSPWKESTRLFRSSDGEPMAFYDGDLHSGWDLSKGDWQATDWIAGAPDA